MFIWKYVEMKFFGSFDFKMSKFCTIGESLCMPNFSGVAELSDKMLFKGAGVK